MKKDKNERRHKVGNLESKKFESKRKDYESYLANLASYPYNLEDYLHYFPLFVGDMTIARYLCMIDGYRETSHLNGHVADVGVYKGASSFLFAKLIKIFSPNSLCQVHGFDWFKGNIPSKDYEKNIKSGLGVGNLELIKKMIADQNLESVLHIHNLDLTKDLNTFFNENLHLKFRLIFMDSGTYDVVKSALPFFWERLVKGGQIIFDQYNFDVAPGETLAVDEILGDNIEIRTRNYSWMPTAYIVK
jgi:hypothetical protein